MKLYAVNTEFLEGLPKEEQLAWLALTDQDRREHIMRLGQERSRTESLCAGLLLRYGFLQEGYTQSQWENVRIRRGEHGKPQLTDYPEFCYSLSHSGKWVICGVHDKNVGVDIQRLCLSEKKSGRIAGRFFSQEECARLEEAEEAKRELLFYKMWTAKESFAKFTGEGIGTGIDRYLTSEDYKEITDTRKYTSAKIRMYESIPEYMVCVCVGKEDSFADRIEILSAEDFTQR